MLHLPALGGICPCWHLFQEKVWKIPMGNMSVAPFDAILLMSFGGPQKPADVLPFLQNVTRGRGIPVERLEEVGEHFGLTREGVRQVELKAISKLRRSSSARSARDLLTA